MSETDTLSRPFSDCREGQVPYGSRHCKIDVPLPAAGFLTGFARRSQLRNRSGTGNLMETAVKRKEAVDIENAGINQQPDVCTMRNELYGMLYTLQFQKDLRRLYGNR